MKNFVLLATGLFVTGLLVPGCPREGTRPILLKQDVGAHRPGPNDARMDDVVDEAGTTETESLDSTTDAVDAAPRDTFDASPDGTSDAVESELVPDDGDAEKDTDVR